MKFEWDPAKARLNLRKHATAFDEAITAFAGPHVEFPDDREDYGEDRTILVGQANGRVVVVVYAWRGESRRIISARKATKQEREAYYAQIAGSLPS